jgi:hypothetical protein
VRALAWAALFAACLGLGYPAVARYDPRQTGNRDAAEYARLVETWPPEPTPRLRSRLLLPLVAKPVAFLARGRSGSWDPVMAGLVVAGALFSATTAWLLAGVGTRLLGDPAAGLLAATLYLLAFAVPNFHLAGLVDAGEACALMVVVRVLLDGRWALLPVVVAAGAAAKETAVPLGVALGAGWALAEAGRPGAARRWAATAAAAGLGVAAVAALLSAVAGRPVAPWSLPDLGRSAVGLPEGLVRCLTDRGFWYVLGWLAPLGLAGVRGLPRPWLAGAGAAAATALLLGAAVDARGNAARGVFDAAGPLLALGTARLLAGAAGRRPGPAPAARGPARD